MPITILGEDSRYAAQPLCGLPLSEHVRRFADSLDIPGEMILYLMADAAFLTAPAVTKALEKGQPAQLDEAALIVPAELDSPELAAAGEVAAAAQWLRGRGVAFKPQMIERSYTRRVTDPVLLAEAAALIRKGINEKLMRSGVLMIDPAATYIDADVQIGEGTLLHPGCTLTGATRVGRDCTLLPHCRLEDTLLGDHVTVENSVLLQSQVEEGSTVGPFAYLRPGTRVGPGCRVGDFVEIKNSTLGAGTKVSHLTYVGDSDLGKDINLGCGVVFVNYDGKKKTRSTVGDHAFIGCNVNLVSPVNIGQDAYIAAGSTITEDVPQEAFAIARSRQTVKEGWVARRKEEGKL